MFFLFLCMPSKEIIDQRYVAMMMMRVSHTHDVIGSFLCFSHSFSFCVCCLLDLFGICIFSDMLFPQTQPLRPIVGIAESEVEQKFQHGGYGFCDIHFEGWVAEAIHDGIRQWQGHCWCFTGVPGLAQSCLAEISCSFGCLCELSLVSICFFFSSVCFTEDVFLVSATKCFFR